MCGIFGILIKNNNNNKIEISKYIIDGLDKLQNRGYDSCGIFSIVSKNTFENTFKNNIAKFKISKYISKNDIMALDKMRHVKHFGNNAIGHTRWATHGKINKINSHPHLDYKYRMAIVHNGIIENYMELKNLLISKNVNFFSETDTEVIINLISYQFDIFGDMEEAINETTNMLKGSWAFVVSCVFEPDILYISKKDSPLLIGVSNLDGDEKIILISSEKSAFSKNTEKYKILENEENLKININSFEDFYNEENWININNTNNTFANNNNNDIVDEKNGYDSWMKKEIFQQPDTIVKTFNEFINEMDTCELFDTMFDNVIFLGCGTSFNACLVSSINFKKSNYFNNVMCINASEFSKYDIPKNGKTCAILLSQSGETKDLYDSLKIIKKYNIYTFGIIGVRDSLISRNVDKCFYLGIGREVAVASTKSFTSQIVLLNLLLKILSEEECDWNNEYEKVFELCKSIKIFLSGLENLNLENLNLEINLNIFEKLKKFEKMFILGKGIYYPITLEGSLKLKEIPYIFCQGYQGGELKHGPFALIDSDVLVCLIAIKQSGEVGDVFEDIEYNKMISTIKQVEVRGAEILVITTEQIEDYECIIIPKNDDELYQSVISVIFFQYMSYKIAKLKKLNVDFPRNLAKCVTVD